MGRSAVLRTIATAVVGLTIGVVAYQTVPEHLRIWITPALLVIGALETAATKLVRRRRSIAAPVPSSRPEATDKTA